MNQNDAKKIFYDYMEKQKYYKKIKILSIDEKEKYFLFEFSEEDDDQPIDYPIIGVHKRNKSVRELSFINEDDVKIIYGK